MSELAIVIRFSVYHMIKQADIDLDKDTDESLLDQHKN